MKKNVVFLALLVLIISAYGYGYNIEKVDLGEGKSLNYVFQQITKNWKNSQQMNLVFV